MTRRERMIAKYGEPFIEFSEIYPHRSPSWDRADAFMLWTGKKRLTDQSKITPSMWPEIIEGAKIYADTHGSDPYRWNECRWLRAGQWEMVLEAQEEEEQRKANMDEDEKTRRDILDFNRAFRKWCTANPRMPGQPKHTVREYKDHLEANRPKLRVVEG